jgi:hypothetical protein
MPFALAIAGILLLVSALRGTSGALFAAIKADFTGSGNYLYWVVAIMIVGSIGYVKKLQPVSDAFLALLLIVLFISNKGFFAQFTAGLNADSSMACVKNASTPQTDAANAAAAKLPGAGVGFTMPTLQPGQSLGDPFALGPM